MKFQTRLSTLVFGLFAVSNGFAAVTPSQESAVNDGTSSYEEPTEIVEAPKPARFYIKGGLGATASNGEAYDTNSFGGSFNLSAGGFITPRWTAGLAYRDTLTTTSDLGMFGGGFFASKMYGLETEYSLAHGEHDDFRLGAKAVRVVTQGVSTALYVPYEFSKLSTWGFGPTLSYAHYFSSGFGLGFDISYLRALPRKASMAGVSYGTVSVPSFGVTDVAFELEYRFH